MRRHFVVAAVELNQNHSWAVAENPFGFAAALQIPFAAVVSAESLFQSPSAAAAESLALGAAENPFAAAAESPFEVAVGSLAAGSPFEAAAENRVVGSPFGVVAESLAVESPSAAVAESPFGAGQSLLAYYLCRIVVARWEG